MGESSSTHQNRSRLGIGLRNSGGEIVEVQGGHIVRSTGRKDRHSKVCTAKGPRDRRVRLAAHTAIQFYDVQDRLGYDRPSKAVDWLIKKAKSAIDELAELPAWNPITTCSAAPNAEDVENSSKHHQQQQDQHQQQVCIGGNDMMIVNVQQQQQQENANNSSFLPPSLDSDAIADTIKSFFPMGASSSSSSAMQFQSFQTPQDLRQNQDLRLSLQSFQDPVYPSHHNSNDQQPHSHSHSHSQQPHSQVLLSGTPLGFDGGWQEHQAELSRFQRFAAWNNAGGGDAGSSGSGGYLFNLPPVGAAVPQHQLLSSHNQFFSSQRGPLQSSNTPSVRAWMDPITMANAMADHHSNTNSHQQQQHQHQQHHLHPSAVPMYPSSFSGIGGFSGFHIPARIQGDEEEHDGYSDKPSSASSDSRH